MDGQRLEIYLRSMSYCLLSLYLFSRVSSKTLYVQNLVKETNPCQKQKLVQVVKTTQLQMNCFNAMTAIQFSVLGIVL